MQGYAALWIPGTDHAGTETQITFERELKKQGKSRFDFDRETLYNQIHDFVFANKSAIENQIRVMGASVDWDRYTFTLDDKVIETVESTFEKLAKEDLVYRGDYMVNFCPICGTTYADIEISYEERKDPFYEIRYGQFTIGTVRPETKFRDTALAVNPTDKKYQEFIGQTFEIPGLLGDLTMTIIPDSEVDPKFGTGIMKVTPAHDPHDFELGKKFNLPVNPIIDLNGRMDFRWFLEQSGTDEKYRKRAENYHGKKVKEARGLMVADLEADRLLIKTNLDYTHSVPVCKAGHEIEPMVLPNWFIKVETLKKPAFEAVKKGEVKVFPKWQEITYTRWMENMHDWAISRQNVWGIRIPAWYDTKENPKLLISFLSDKKEVITGNVSDLLADYTLPQINKGIQKVTAPSGSKYIVSRVSPGENFIQETDTFDTWFSSGQWPLVTLGYPNSDDFKKFYPTDVLETGWEILSKWVSRMVMFGIYLTGKPPFHSIYLHGIVRALDGRKMSKSLGNVINPEEYIKDYGVDALRMGLITGTANGKDFSFPKDKIIAYKHFANKIWNMARFMLMMAEQDNIEFLEFENIDKKALAPEDKQILKDLEKLIKEVDTHLDKFRFADAAESIYQFMWHTIADVYIESVKNREDKEVTLSNLNHVYTTCLKLLHPFMPFITEEIYQKLPLHGKSIMISKWPKA